MPKIAAITTAVALTLAIAGSAQACTYGQTWQECRNAEGSWLEQHEQEYRERQQREDAFFQSEMQRLHNRQTYELNHPNADTSLWPYVPSYSR
jgi:hypothetical protein